jgi:aminoglycoside phosphotransferase (APT) family kinase protein
MTLPGDVVAWVEERCAGRVVDIEQQVRWRPHHFLTVKRSEDTIEVLARSDRQAAIGGSALMEHFDIAHEARVLQALQGRNLRVPKFYGFNEKHRIILMARAAGTNELSEAPDDDTRRHVMSEYIDQLALLHQLDIVSMNPSGLDIPTTPEDVAFAGKFSYVENDFDRWRPKMSPEPLLELGVWWLHANVPQGDRRVSFVQGDTGPGQFMFADGHLTALIDWELAHIGDPMLDLGVMRMRNMLYPTGPLARPITRYEKLSGRPLDWPALRFYTVLSMLLTPLALAPMMQRPSARIKWALPSFGWNATLRRGLCDALAEAIDMEIEPPPLPATPAAETHSFIDYLIDHLEHNCAEVASDDNGRFQITSAASIARAVALECALGAELLDADLDDMGIVLGRRPVDRETGLAELSQLVEDGPACRLEKLVWLFSRTERRREHVCKPLMVAQSSEKFERLTPQKLQEVS